MQILTGIAVSPGVAIAEAVVLDAEELRIPQRMIPQKSVTAELDNLEKAVGVSVSDLEEQRDRVRERLGHDAADVFSWHIGVLKDASLNRQIVALIEQKRYSAAYATSTVMRNQQRRFQQMTDPLLAERIRDVQDIERRLLRNLLGASGEDLAHLTREIVLVAHDLTTSQTAKLSETMVAGVALDLGGPTSHTAILLRSWGRPAVVGLNTLSGAVSGGDLLIVDGVHHLVIVNPDEETLAEYSARRDNYVRLTDDLRSLRELPAATDDGVTVSLMANIEYPREVTTALDKGANGVGLYRSEFLFLAGQSPDEEEQYEAYREAIEGMEGRPVTIRTFDLGADKFTQEKTIEPERNPMLGNRSLRYSLQNLEMFKVQLRAILRAATAGPTRVMFPLVTSLIELRQAKMTIRDAMEDLEEAGVPFKRDIEIGMMLETPAAASQCRDFVKEVAFVSIGTNDLIQYLLAADRGNERVARYYTPSHPAVVKTLKDVIRACAKAGVDCSLCGEMAGEPIYTLLLIGLGLRSLSMSPHNIPEIKKLIRAATMARAQRVARRALTLDTETQVTNYLRSETKKLLPDDPI
ncbi:MAG: phosphoenolpyruvate--protein phosphotransferase [Phycisphaerales bacterium]|nr:phosphoenolpyruvate--protein phosphotransferase [Phycisphaerales bacterium]